MKKHGIALIVMSLIMIGYGVWVLATGASQAWVPYGFAVIWGVFGVVAIDYFAKRNRVDEHDEHEDIGV